MPTWDEIEERRERERLVDGGTVKTASGSQLSFRWATHVPTMAELERMPEELAFRRKTLDAFRTIKTRKRAARKVDPAKARAAFEERGRAFIEGGYECTAKRRPCALRVFYRSAGGEVLVCESEPMTFDACEKARSSRPWFDWALAVETVPATPLSMHAIKELEIPHEVRSKLAEELKLRSWRDAPSRARFVVFPSQRLEPVEVTDASAVHGFEVTQTITI